MAPSGAYSCGCTLEWEIAVDIYMLLEIVYICRKRDGELFMYNVISNAGGGKLAVSLSRVHSVHTGPARRLLWVFWLKT